MNKKRILNLILITAAVLLFIGCIGTRPRTIHVLFTGLPEEDGNCTYTHLNVYGIKYNGQEEWIHSQSAWHYDGYGKPYAEVSFTSAQGFRQIMAYLVDIQPGDELVPRYVTSVVLDSEETMYAGSIWFDLSFLEEGRGELRAGLSPAFAVPIERPLEEKVEFVLVFNIFPYYLFKLEQADGLYQLTLEGVKENLIVYEADHLIIKDMESREIGLDAAILLQSDLNPHYLAVTPADLTRSSYSIVTMTLAKASE